MTESLAPKKRFPWGHLLLFGWLPGFLRIWAYRTLLGYRIGRRVSLGFGAVLVGDEVDVGDEASISFLTIVWGRHVRIGRHSSIGAMSYLRTEAISIGEDARINEQVYVGGPQLPESRFELGSRTIVMQMTFINTTKPVTIGDNSGVGGHCLIFSHGSWSSALEGYPVTFAPVTIGRDVWLPWRVFVLPGSVIGDGAVIGAGSLVSGTIPARSLAFGSPARVVKSPPDYPPTIGADQRSALLDQALAEFDRLMAYEQVGIQNAPEASIYSRGSAWRLIRVRHDAESLQAVRANDTVLAERALTEEDLGALRRANAFWLDVARYRRSESGSPLTEELSLFLARYGIRCARER